MAVARVTQGMMTQRALSSLQLGLGRLATTQEQISTGKRLNRPSDSPTDTVAAMRVRASLADQKQYVRNGEDAQGWLNQADSTLQGMVDQVRRVRDLAMQGATTIVAATDAREALATEVDQLREGLLASANTTYLGRPIFGGVTAGATAYAASGTYSGTTGDVARVIGDGSTVVVNVDGPDVFGPDGANLFDELTTLAASLRAGDTTAVGAALTGLDDASTRMTTILAEVGTKESRVDRALQTAQDAILDMTSSLSDLEDVDLPRATVDLQMQEVAYQAALATTAKVVQPSLLEFLR